MATQSSEERRKSSRPSTSSKKAAASTATVATAALSAVSPDVLLDLVQRLGLVDLVLGRIKSRIEETDIDELLDEAADYLRRHPEVLVVALGAITVAAALVVYLNKLHEWDGTERRRNEPRPEVTRAPGRIGRTRTLDSRRNAQ